MPHVKELLIQRRGSVAELASCDINMPTFKRHGSAWQMPRLCRHPWLCTLYACTATTDHMHATAGTANIKYSTIPGSRSRPAARRACTRDRCYA